MIVNFIPLPFDTGERGDPAEVSGGVTDRDPWMGVAWDDMMWLSNYGEEIGGGVTQQTLKHLRTTRQEKTVCIDTDFSPSALNAPLKKRNNNKSMTSWRHPQNSRYYGNNNLQKRLTLLWPYGDGEGEQSLYSPRHWSYIIGHYISSYVSQLESSRKENLHSFIFSITGLLWEEGYREKKKTRVQK